MAVMRVDRSRELQCLDPSKLRGLIAMLAAQVPFECGHARVADDEADLEGPLCAMKAMRMMLMSCDPTDTFDVPVAFSYPRSDRSNGTVKPSSCLATAEAAKQLAGAR